METVRVSPKFQVVIPKNIRDTMRLRAGQKIEILHYDNRIELIPIRSVKQLRGFLKGISTAVPRDRDRV